MIPFRRRRSPVSLDPVARALMLGRPVFPRCPMPGSIHRPATFPRNLAVSVFTVLTAFTLPLPAPGIGMHHDVPESTYLELANNAPDFPPGSYPDFSPVAAVGLQGRNGKFEVVGSATLVAPRWVLTAAHVVLSGKRGRAFEEGLEVRFGLSASRSNLRFSVQEVLTPIPPEQLRPLLKSRADFTERQVVHAEFHDMALLQLSAPVPSISPARFDTRDEALLGRLVYIAGYGDAAFGNNPKTRTWTMADRKRAAQNIIDREIRTNPHDPSSRGGIVLFDFDSGAEDRNSLNLRSRTWDSLFGAGHSSALPTRLEGASYPGDSGGPAFAKLGDQWILVAISGYGTGFPPDKRRTTIQYGDILVYTRIAPHATWIERSISPSVPAPPESIVSRAEPAEVVSESVPADESAGSQPLPPIFRKVVPGVVPPVASSPGRPEE